MSVRLHINVDHVATLRQARGTRYPDPVEAALCCERAGADGITVHLREDRRHIQDRDLRLLKELVKSTLNLEMAPTDAMVSIATQVAPDIVTLVPERREEQTTESGLDVVSMGDTLGAIKAALASANVRTHLFIDPVEAQIRAAVELGVDGIELHTGSYCETESDEDLDQLAEAATLATSLSPDIVVAAGHGLNARNVGDLIASVAAIEEVNIGHALIGDALFDGFAATIERYRDALDEGEAEREP